MWFLIVWLDPYYVYVIFKKVVLYKYKFKLQNVNMFWYDLKL